MSDAVARLVMMANQIATAFRTEGREGAIAATSGHIVQFWDPSMRRVLSAHVDAGGAGLNDIALAAAEHLRPAPSCGVAGQR